MPSDLKRLSKLSSIRLRENALTGCIPRCYLACSSTTSSHPCRIDLQNAMKNGEPVHLRLEFCPCSCGEFGTIGECEACGEDELGHLCPGTEEVWPCPVGKPVMILCRSHLFFAMNAHCNLHNCGHDSHSRVLF